MHISLKNSSFEGTLLFNNETSITLNCNIRPSVSIQFSSESKIFRVFIASRPISMASAENTLTPLELENITSLSLKKLKNDWFKLSTNNITYWVHQQLRNVCHFIAYHQKPENFDYEKERNNHYGCTTSGIIMPTYSAEISLSENVTTQDAQIALNKGNAWQKNPEKLVYMIKKSEEVFSYTFGMGYVNGDVLPNAAYPQINKEMFSYFIQRERSNLVAYTPGPLAVNSVAENIIKLKSFNPDNSEFERTIVVVPNGKHFLFKELELPLSEQEYTRYCKQALKEIPIGKGDIQYISCSYDPITGQVAE